MKQDGIGLKRSKNLISSDFDSHSKSLFNNSSDLFGNSSNSSNNIDSNNNNNNNNNSSNNTYSSRTSISSPLFSSPFQLGTTKDNNSPQFPSMPDSSVSLLDQQHDNDFTINDLTTADLDQVREQSFDNSTTTRQRLSFIGNWLLLQIRTSTYHTWIKLALLVLVIVGICLAVFVFKLQTHLDVLQTMVDKFGIVPGGLIFVAIFICLILFLVPVTIPTILAGIIFKLWFGILFVWCSSMLGATIAFLLGKYVFRDSIQKKIEKNKKLQAIDQAIGQEGWKIVLLLRLTPIVPEAILNYALAVTNVNYIPYIICTGIGLVPGVSFFIYMGTMIGNISEIGKRKPMGKSDIIMYAVSGVAMIITIAFITIIVRRAINKKLDFEENRGILDEEAKERLLDEDIVQEPTERTPIFVMP
ncbi:hypothetical protein SAMD00019534_075990 [Acytostelium subglobosum LB1]|uniref:hypothetical protein n=1 Tax=Acytostelium subglobosum LB1 TaxID=1410327 RepID=UPI000644F233|nr:hypothetical protein SAMD00019534_075990 [Acytostelium subglobosum LB1]GAM24424.1 hypothetical protein SAMD00019534_075990 [Acytostelium subglobosum LB1]|eukprot:XP_012752750.1 hypothetical protein SAMD00019534_075990 [Acytostelium subglobosum LB1]